MENSLFFLFFKLAVLSSLMDIASLLFGPVFFFPALVFVF